MEQDTLCVHGGTTGTDTSGAIAIPIYQTASFAHPAPGESTGYDYTRDTNPTRDALEAAMAKLDDGAAALVIMSAEKAKELGVKPLAKIVTGASAGVDPSIMGIGPVYATRKALKKANLELKDIDLIEANEAFAAQSVAVANELGFDMDKVNVNGGAVALGHPIGASGCRILVTLLYEMKRRNAKYGLATLCVGGGMGVATIVEGM